MSAPGLEAVGLSKNFGRVTAVARVDLQAGPGEVLGLLGPNGAGKTTTLRMLCGLLTPSAGVVRVGGRDLASEPSAAKARLGYLDEDPVVYPHLTGREFLHLVADLYGVARGEARERQIDRLFTAFDFADKSSELISSYSHGTKQKIGLASVLIHEPEVMLLDEPTNGLDPRAARRVKDLLQELAARGRTVVLSTHILEIAEALCDRVAIVNRGRIIATGTLSDLRAGAGQSDASLEDLFLQLTGGPETRELIQGLIGG